MAAIQIRSDHKRFEEFLSEFKLANDEPTAVNVQETNFLNQKAEEASNDSEEFQKMLKKWSQGNSDAIFEDFKQYEEENMRSKKALINDSIETIFFLLEQVHLNCLYNQENYFLELHEIKVNLHKLKEKVQEGNDPAREIITLIVLINLIIRIRTYLDAVVPLRRS